MNIKATRISLIWSDEMEHHFDVLSRKLVYLNVLLPVDEHIYRQVYQPLIRHTRQILENHNA